MTWPTETSSVGLAPLVLRHERLELHDAALGTNLFADLYEALSPGPRPLICYWGGAISPEDYERRRRTTPEIIAAEWRAALESGSPPSDLLAVPVPDLEPCSSAAVRSRVFRTFWHQLLPRLPNPQPPAVGCVGYSAGAFLAAWTALDGPPPRILVTLGGVGMTVALLDAFEYQLGDLTVASFANTEDPCADDTLDFVHALADRKVRARLHRGRGGHDYPFYAANGSVRQAFAFAMARLAARRRHRGRHSRRPGVGG